MQVKSVRPDTSRSAAELAQLAQLRTIDQKVRSHEQAHLAAGGPYVTGGPSYQYATGPDHHLYAVGGEVSIDAAPVEGDPQATIQKMLTVIAAANAPADPSLQDQKVAAQAAASLATAQAETVHRTYASNARGEDVGCAVLVSLVA
jgi:SprA-related family